MTSTFPVITNPEPAGSGTGAMLTFPTGQFYADVLTQKVTSNIANSNTFFIKNVLTASPKQECFVEPENVQIYTIVVIDGGKFGLTSVQWLEKKTKWRDIEYRQAYMEAANEQGIAWQIRVNRERRGWSQTRLAKAIDSKQSAISRAENPAYGKHSIETLIRVANAFDCALQVKFVPYSTLAKDRNDLSAEALYSKGYEEEIGS